MTLFPAVAFYHCATAGCEEVTREEVAFLCDDLKKDAHMSDAIIKRILAHLREKMGSELKKVILASDGCAAQFKSKLPFYFLSQTKLDGVRWKGCTLGLDMEKMIQTGQVGPSKGV